MTILTTLPLSVKKSVRLGFAAASVVVFTACGSMGHAALAPQSPVTAPATDASTTEPLVAQPTTTQPSPPVTAGTAATIPPTVPSTTVPTTPPMAPPATAAPATPPAPLGTAPTAPVEQPPLVAPAASTDPIAVVDANGDAVIVGADGSITTGLADGTDPDDPLPEEGPVEYVAGVAVTNDLSTRIVGTCCEPVPGWLIVSNDRYPPSEVGAFGHAPVISPDQTQLAAITTEGLFVSGFDLISGYRYVSIEAADPNVLDVEWVDDTHVVTLVSSSSGTALHRYEVAADGLVATGVVSVPAGSALAGVNAGVVYAIGDDTTLVAYATDSLAPSPERDIVLPVVPLSASMHDGELRWIDQERNLHIGETTVPGHYIWVA